jgi:hypothetical protein
MTINYPSDHIFTRQFLDHILTSIIGKTLGEVDAKKVFAKTKGNQRLPVLQAMSLSNRSLDINLTGSSSPIFL